MKFIAVIPARYSSVRFPGKPLALLKGKPVIQHVYGRVVASHLFDSVLVATDDMRIADAVAGFGGIYKMTADSHASGSDRIAEVVESIDCDVVFNVQGDEPFIKTEPLYDLKAVFSSSNVQVATLMSPLNDVKALLNINIVKVVVNNDMGAMYFSRSPIPFNRDDLGQPKYFRHIGVYAYKKETLLNFTSLPHGILEQTEKLEQLRFLENSIPVKMVMTDYQGIGIDTPEDLKQAESLLHL